MSGAQEGLFAFGADEMLHVPLFAEGVDHPILDRTTTCPANRNAHLIQEKARVYEQMRSGPLIAEDFDHLIVDRTPTCAVARQPDGKKPRISS